MLESKDCVRIQVTRPLRCCLRLVLLQTEQFLFVFLSNYSVSILIFRFDGDCFSSNSPWTLFYSDVTVVINSIHSQCGFATFSGPMGLSNWTSPQGSFWSDMLMKGAMPVLSMLPNSGLPAPYTITSGKARGRLIGSNLSLICNLLGSLYMPLSDFVGNILFMEDVGEAPYKIDRYLTQLEMFGVFNVVSGFVSSSFFFFTFSSISFPP